MNLRPTWATKRAPVESVLQRKTLSQKECSEILSQSRIKSTWEPGTVAEEGSQVLGQAEPESDPLSKSRTNKQKSTGHVVRGRALCPLCSMLKFKP